jgi:predicted  nucleic acid-binding Zn-ribbon protein
LTVRIVPSGVEALSGLASQNGKLAWRETRAEDLADAVNNNAQKLKQLEAYSTRIEQLAQRKDLATNDLIALSHERAQIQVERENLQNVAAQQQRRLDTNLLQLDFRDEVRGHRLGLSLSAWTDELREGIDDALSMLAYGIPFLLLVFPLALGWRWFWRRVTRKSRNNLS